MIFSTKDKRYQYTVKNPFQNSRFYPAISIYKLIGIRNLYFRKNFCMYVSKLFLLFLIHVTGYSVFHIPILYFRTLYAEKLNRKI